MPHTAEFKAKVALEAIRGVRTLSELSSMHGGTLDSDWAVEEAVGRRGGGTVPSWKRSCGQERAGVDGTVVRGDRLKVGVDWLKKKH